MTQIVYCVAFMNDLLTLSLRMVVLEELPNSVPLLEKVAHRPLRDGAYRRENVHVLVSHEVQHLVELHPALVLVVGARGRLLAAHRAKRDRAAVLAGQRGDGVRQAVDAVVLE